jgi:hypothetical protein
MSEQEVATAVDVGFGIRDAQEGTLVAPGPTVVQPVAAGPVDAQLAARLFTPPERWGWQYVSYEIPPPVEAAVGARPEFRPPLPPPTAGPLEVEVRQRRRAVIWRAIPAGLFLLIALVSQGGVGGFMWLLTLIFALRIIPAYSKYRQSRALLQAHLQPFQQFHAQEEARYQAVAQRWNAAAAAHNAAIQQASHMQANAPQWYPIQPVAPARRLDVFGGDPSRHGWALLLATMGTSVLSSGSGIGLLDLTGQDVGGALESFAIGRGIAARRLDLPGGLDRLELFTGLSSDELADLVARAVAGAEQTGEREGEWRRSYSFLAGVVRAVVKALEDGSGTPPRFARIAAGVQVLRRTYREGPLTDDEVGRLNELIDDFSGYPEASRELYFLSEQLGLLATPSAQDPVPLVGAAGSNGVLARGSFGVVTTSPGDRRDRKDMLDLLLVLSVKNAMARGGASAVPEVLVVAGADRLGPDLLTDLSDQCQRSGVRLMLMMDHLHGNLNTLIGAGSTVLLMQLGNHKDAEEAAAFIGREHKLVISAMTREVSTSFGDGGSDSFGISSQDGTTSSPGGAFHRRAPEHDSLNESRSHSWQQARNWSLTEGLSSGTTQSRVYELAVEPSAIQTLPATAFVLVDNAAGSRRVITGDCNPGISLRDRVSLSPQLTA